MTKVVLILLTLFLLSFLGCSNTPAPTQNANVQAAPAAAPSASPTTMSVAPTLAMPAPNASGVSGTNKPGPNDQKKLPSVIEDRLKRALTLEEINQLPPEIRDTILRAQGRLPASPAPAPKKK